MPPAAGIVTAVGARGGLRLRRARRLSSLGALAFGLSTLRLLRLAGLITLRLLRRARFGSGLLAPCLRSACLLRTLLPPRCLHLLPAGALLRTRFGARLLPLGARAILRDRPLGGRLANVGPWIPLATGVLTARLSDTLPSGDVLRAPVLIGTSRALRFVDDLHRLAATRLVVGDLALNDVPALGRSSSTAIVPGALAIVTAQPLEQAVLGPWLCRASRKAFQRGLRGREPRLVFCP